MSTKPQTGWQLFRDGDPFFESLMTDIYRARSSIYIEVYILLDDEIGGPMIDLLADKQRAGVDVRLIIDGVGSINLSAASIERIRNLGIPFRIFRPLRIFNFFLLKNHRRDHRKLIVIDREICYLGGMNIKAAHSARIRGDQAWRDAMIRLQGDIALEAHAIFDRMWNFVKHNQPFYLFRSTGERKFKRKEFRILENMPYFQRRRYRRIFVRYLKSARSSIYIQSAYFIPRLFLINKLIKMAAKGIDVRIILNEKSDVPAVTWAGRAIYYTLLLGGVRLYERKGRFSHAKVTVVDSRFAIIGSTNLDYRSFLHNMEIDLVVHREDVCEQIRSEFLKDLELCDEITLDGWLRRPLLHRLLENFFFLFRYWL